MADLFRAIFKSGRQSKIFVEHMHNDQQHRRAVTLTEDFESLNKGILKMFNEILIPKIAESTGLTEEEVQSFKHSVKITEAINLSAEAPNGDQIQIRDVAKLKKNMTVQLHVVDVKKGKNAKNAQYPKGPYRFWCPVHSQGQGYLKIGEEVKGERNGGYTISNNGTAADRTRITLEKKEQADPLKPEEYSIHLHLLEEQGEYYMCCKRDFVIARNLEHANQVQDKENETEDESTFHLKQNSSMPMYYTIQCTSNDNRMLKIADKDCLIATAPKEQNLQYQDPAYFFTLCLIEDEEQQCEK